MEGGLCPGVPCIGSALWPGCFSASLWLCLRRVGVSEPWVPTPVCRGSRFCFTWWLLATCFLRSAHSVSHFTLPQAERSIHLVQTLLTRLGRRRPLLGPTRACCGWAARWSGQLGEILHPPLSLSWPGKSFSELANALAAASSLLFRL